MPSMLPTRRRLRRVVSLPRIEQGVRWLGLRRTVGRRSCSPPDSLVTSTGRGSITRDRLPVPGTRSFDRLARVGGRSQLLSVRPRSLTSATAAALSELAARGVPTWVDGPQPADAPPDSDVWSLLTQPPGRDDSDLDRYVRSVRLARAAAVTTPTTVSILLATRRPSMLDHAIESIRRQQRTDLQLVVGLHGAWPDDSERRIRSLWAGELVTVRADATIHLGALLGSMTARADGSLVTKWDDDDWYGPHHVGDLVRALESSNASIVGKAAEFVWLEAIGETIRRPALGARTYSANLAGGTLMMTKTVLREVGGFPDVPRSVDRVLIDRVRARGGDVYRTHGLEFVLRRSSSGEHTWDAATDYFLADVVARRPGLDLSFADIRAHDDGHRS